MRNDDVVDVGVDGEREVAGKRPRRRGPGQRELAGLEPEPHRDRGVLALAVDVVHAGLGVGQRRLAAPAVGQHAEALVDQTLVPQGLEGPHDRLHVVEVEGLVVVVEVDPAGLSLDVLLPLVGEAQHRGAAGVVELRDPHRLDLGLVSDAELLLGLDLGRQPVAVPAESALHPAPAHGLVARHDVLDVAGEQVAVVRQAVGERWAVVEDELVGTVDAGVALVDGCLERAVGAPEVEDFDLQRREGRAGRDALVTGLGGRVPRVGHGAPRTSCRDARTTPADSAVGAAVPPRVPPPAWWSGAAARSSAVTGRSRPVLLGRPGPAACSSGGSPVMAGSTPVLESYRGSQPTSPPARARSASRGCAISVAWLHHQRPVVAPSASRGCTISVPWLHHQRPWLHHQRRAVAPSARCPRLPHQRPR